MASPKTIARLEAQIQRRAAHCLQFEISDPRATFVTITRVELSKDITSGKIHWTVLGDEGERSKAAHMLEHAAGFIQRQVAGVLRLRRMPHLRWVHDDSLEEAQRVDSLIRAALERDRRINPGLAGSDPAEEGADEGTAGAGDPERPGDPGGPAEPERPAEPGAR